MEFSDGVTLHSQVKHINLLEYWNPWRTHLFLLIYSYFFPKYDLMGHLQTESSFLLQVSIQKLNTWLSALQYQILISYYSKEVAPVE